MEWKSRGVCLGGIAMRENGWGEVSGMSRTVNEQWVLFCVED